MLDAHTVAAVTLRCCQRLSALPARAAGALVRIYQKTVSPALVVLNPGCGCRFTPTCSHYAREALQAHGFVLGSLLALRRLVKCGPWHPGGEDPVPLSPLLRRTNRARSLLTCTSAGRAGSPKA